MQLEFNKKILTHNFILNIKIIYNSHAYEYFAIKIYRDIDSVTPVLSMTFLRATPPYTPAIH